ncbi:hypothetical protein GALMADRAFT_401685 [Galerina marginata CBS 339.88]|uniref:Uncharacterized protein n=1 Tax=Galerina marginata (strain CBS 339.88) TaxID=685588 RepID=A0A067TUS2_GALM3|nr:hypothetical protein GALMADRAFT_401685 [Galerina marginata CBS 339.88]
MRLLPYLPQANLQFSVPRPRPMSPHLVYISLCASIAIEKQAEFRRHSVIDSTIPERCFQELPGFLRQQRHREWLYKSQLWPSRRVQRSCRVEPYHFSCATCNCFLPVVGCPTARYEIWS